TVWYNGNDAVILKKGGTSGSIVDVIGQLDYDPGIHWGDGEVATSEKILRRKSSICIGTTTATEPFDPSEEWEGYRINDLSDLGHHYPIIIEKDPETIEVCNGEGSSFKILASFVSSYQWQLNV